MDEKLEILLNSTRNIDSVDVDSFNKIELSNNITPILEYNIRNVLSVTELFDLEREENEVYRIYGKMEYMSLLNGLKNNYQIFQDFFRPQREESKNIFNSFDFYLVKPAESGYTQNISKPTEYVRYFEVIATPNEFDLFPAGFGDNVFEEQTYVFNFNMDFDVSGILDGFGMPLTELYLYAQYKRRVSETLTFTKWSNTGVESKVVFSPLSLNIGDLLTTSVGDGIGDVIEYSKFNYFQTQNKPQTFYIKTPVKKNNSSPISDIFWKYNPFIPFKLRYFANEPTRANSGDTSYEETSKIPNYATNLGGGNFVWREILPQGYTDPLSGNGVDYPFVNKRRYLFSTLVLDVIPDLNHPNTYDFFKDIWFDNNTTIINSRPISDINKIGKPCL